MVLRYLEGKSTTQAAETLGISASAVTTGLSRAIEQLRTRFQRKGISVASATLASTIATHASAVPPPPTLASTLLGITGSGTISTVTLSATARHMIQGARTSMSVLHTQLPMLVLIGTVATVSTVAVVQSPPPASADTESTASTRTATAVMPTTDTHSPEDPESTVERTAREDPPVPEVLVTRFYPVTWTVTGVKSDFEAFLRSEFAERGIHFSPRHRLQYEVQIQQVVLTHDESNMENITAAWAQIAADALKNNGPKTESVPQRKISTVPPVNSGEELKRLSTIPIPALRVNRATIQEVAAQLEALSRQHDPEGSGVRVRYLTDGNTETSNGQSSSGSAKHTRPVTLHLRNVTLKDALNTLCSISDLEYDVSEGTVTLSQIGAPSVSRSYNINAAVWDAKMGPYLEMQPEKTVKDLLMEYGFRNTDGMRIEYNRSSSQLEATLSEGALKKLESLLDQMDLYHEVPD